MSTVPWAGNHHIASRKILLVQNFMEIPTDPPEEIFKVFIFVEREAFKPYLNKWLPCLFLNTCEPGTVTVTVKIDVDKAKSRVATTIGYGRESTGCKYDKEPSRAHSNFTHTQSTMDRHDSQITPIRMHACAPNDIIKISGLVDFFCDLYFCDCQSICENQKFAPSENFSLYGITSDSFIMWILDFGVGHWHLVLSLNYQYYHQYRHHKGEDCSLLDWYPATEDVVKKVRESLLIKSFIRWWVNLASAAGCFAIPCSSKTLPSTRLDHQLENLLNRLMSMCIQPTWRFYCFSQTCLPLF